MEWTARLTQLNDVLGDLVPQQNGIMTFIRDAGLKPAMINFGGTAQDIWSNAISEAQKQNKVEDLIHVVLRKYPNDPFLKTALNPAEINYSLSPKLDEITTWNGVDDDTLEVLTMKLNTMLPINFLARGIICSRSVAKVEIRIGNVIDSGTGFLIKPDGLDEVFFITNFHVINDKRDIARTRVIFDYEEDIKGNTKASQSFEIDPDGPWYTSPVAELDSCIFKLRANESLTQFGFIPLNKVTVQKNDFVNIIQHPGGELKKIALYHNIVTNTTDRVVQYLTDTKKGSSGAPVFNSNWDVIALHHAGSESKLNEPKLAESKYRNEGIAINNIIDFLVNNHH